MMMPITTFSDFLVTFTLPSTMKAKQQNVMKAKPLNFARRSSEVSQPPHESHSLRLVASHISMYLRRAMYIFFDK